MFNVELNEQEINYIGQVLSERPFKEVASLIAKIEGQINEQVKEKDKGV